MIHLCPPVGSGVMPCCGRSPFELAVTDQMTLLPELVTCNNSCPAGRWGCKVVRDHTHVG